MDNHDIVRSLGRIEGKLGRIQDELKELRKLVRRVSSLERWRSWLTGGWVAVTAAYAYCRSTLAK